MLQEICPDIEEDDCLGFKEEVFSAVKLAAIWKLHQAVKIFNADILEWFAVDCTKPGHMVMSDTEIVKWAQGHSRLVDALKIRISSQSLRRTSAIHMHLNG
jgi:hypothetical protein